MFMNGTGSMGETEIGMLQGLGSYHFIMQNVS